MAFGLVLLSMETIQTPWVSLKAIVRSETLHNYKDLEPSLRSEK
jgi:hypothetical protein